MKNLYELLGEGYKLNGLIKAKELLFFHPKITLADIPDNISESDFNAQFKLICDQKFDEYKNQFINYEISDAEIKNPFVDHWIQIYTAYDSILLPLSERSKLKMAIKFLEHWGKPEGLSLRDKGLILSYEKEHVKADGSRLYHWFNHYSDPSNRRGFSKKLMTNKQIERIKKIIPYLTEKAQILANDDLKILEANYLKYT